MLLLEGGYGCFDSKGGAINPESNKDKPPTLVDVLDEVRALRKEVALSTCSRPDIDNGEVPSHVIGIHKADGKNDSPNEFQSTCSSLDMDNGEVAVAGMDFTSMDGRMKSSNAMITLDVLIQVAYDGMGIDKEDGNNDYTDSQRETSTLDVLANLIVYPSSNIGVKAFLKEEEVWYRKKPLVLRSVKDRKKRLAMSMDSSFGQQATTTPSLPKKYPGDVVLGRSLNVDPINELMTLEVFVEQLSRPHNCIRDKVTLPDGFSDFIKMQDPPEYRFPWGYRDIVVDREFWLVLACLDNIKQGWLKDSHLDLWIDLMWYFKEPNADWAMVSPHFLTCTLGGSMIDYYSNGVRYPVAWRDLKKVYFLVNEPKKHWCLAELHISTGFITFYDSLGWVCGNKRPWWRTMKRTLRQQLTLYLNEHGVLQSKGIAVETYEIKYMFPKVVRQADVYENCGVWVCIFLYRLSRNLALTVDDPLQTALAYRERMLQYFWSYKIQPEKIVVLDEDYIPFEMKIEIMNRLPVKSLLQFRTVSKSWKSCIDSFTFFFKYGVRKSLNDVFYLTYNHGFQGSMICVDANLIHTPALTNLHIVNLKPICTSRGVWCFSYANNMMVSIANPSIKKEIGVFVPNSQPDSCKILFSFGVRPDNLDPTIVRISYPSSIEGNWSVYVFTLSSLRWDQLNINSLPRKSIRFKRSTQAVVGQFIYWVGHERILADSSDTYKHYLLVSFDMVNHCFQVIDIPDVVMRGLSVPLYVSNLRNSLVLSANIRIPKYYVFVCCQLSIDGGSITSAPTIMTMPSNHFLKLLGFNNHDLPIVEAATSHIMGHTIIHFIVHANLYAGFWSGGLMSYVDLVKVFRHGQ
ncbi:phospholipase-like protein [Tanacetum coccineum]